jgi:hypothetical protein
LVNAIVVDQQFCRSVLLADQQVLVAVVVKVRV